MEWIGPIADGRAKKQMEWIGQIEDGMDRANQMEWIGQIRWNGYIGQIADGMDRANCRQSTCAIVAPNEKTVNNDKTFKQTTRLSHQQQDFQANDKTSKPMTRLSNQ